jgi:hypothetical protein
MNFKLTKKNDKYLECKLIDDNNNQFDILQYTKRLRVDADVCTTSLTLDLLIDDIEVSGDEVYLSVGNDEYKVKAIKEN